MELFTAAHELSTQNHNERVIAHLAADYRYQPAKLLLLDFDVTTVVHGLISPAELAQLQLSASRLGFTAQQVEGFARLDTWGERISGYKLVDSSVAELFPLLAANGVQVVGLTNQPLPVAEGTANYIAIATQSEVFPTLSSFYHRKNVLARDLLAALPYGSHAVFYDDKAANVASMASVDGVSAFSNQINWRQLVGHCLSLWQEG
jgi:hypothetical protein